MSESFYLKETFFCMVLFMCSLCGPWWLNGWGKHLKDMNMLSIIWRSWVLTLVELWVSSTSVWVVLEPKNEWKNTPERVIIFVDLSKISLHPGLLFMSKNLVLKAAIHTLWEKQCNDENIVKKRLHFCTILLSYYNTIPQAIIFVTQFRKRSCSTMVKTQYEATIESKPNITFHFQSQHFITFLPASLFC